jgi:hypothetical protein
MLRLSNCCNSAIMSFMSMNTPDYTLSTSFCEKGSEPGDKHTPLILPGANFICWIAPEGPGKPGRGNAAVGVVLTGIGHQHHLTK